MQFTPDDRETEVREWLAPLCARCEFRVQCKGGLGERLQSAILDALVMGSERVALLLEGASPSADTIERAFSALDSADVALLPDDRGGYALIAMRKPYTELFEGIPWGTEHVLEATMAAGEEERLRVDVIDVMPQR